MKKWEKKQLLKIEEKLPYILTIVNNSNLTNDSKKAMSKSLKKLVKELTDFKDLGADFV